METPYFLASKTSSIISRGETGTRGVISFVGIIPVGVKLIIIPGFFISIQKPLPSRE
jgi:hypothetical protein